MSVGKLGAWPLLAQASWWDWDSSVSLWGSGELTLGFCVPRYALARMHTQVENRLHMQLALLMGHMGPRGAGLFWGPVQERIGG